MAKQSSERMRGSPNARILVLEKTLLKEGFTRILRGMSRSRELDKENELNSIPTVTVASHDRLVGINVVEFQQTAH